MKKLNFKLVAIAFIFASMLFVSCNETDEIVPTEITKSNEIEVSKRSSDIMAAELPPEEINLINAELKALKKAEKGKVYAAKAAGTTLVVGPNKTYTTIQQAVDAAAPGDKIKVRPGTYNEAVSIVTENITITALDGVYLNGYVTIYANSITIKGFNINATLFFGIYANNSEDLNILNNKIISNDLFGIWLQNCPNNLIANNSLETVNTTIVVNDSPFSNITRNKIKGFNGEMYRGISLQFNCENSEISYNSITEATDSGIVSFSDNVTIIRNNCYKNGTGIYINISSENSLISNQCLSNNTYGIYLYYSNNCLVKRNIAYFNGNCGLYAIGSNHNFVSNYTDCEYNQYSNE